ncbi:MAG: GDP-mannose 4,6-dehydratase [Patescibacteria group bacterium]
MPKAFITGVTGQDGAWLTKLLLEKGYTVYGGVRRNSRRNLSSLEFLGVQDKIKLVDFDLTEYSNIFETIKDIQPDEFYNLAAQSFVATSFKQPILTSLTDGIAIAYILDILKTISPKTKFYQASTSEMFGKVQEIPQTERTPLHPRSPYGVAKLYAHWLTINYRESYDMFTSSGILFNHESELRGPEFVTRKITINVAKRYTGQGEILELGNLDAKRDWGYAKEYVEGMYLMLQAEKPDDYVLATGETTSIRDFVNKTFSVIDIDIKWEGEGVNEQGFNSKTGELLVKVNPKFYRPAEVELLIGDASKAEAKLGWKAQTSISQLTEIMVKSDIDQLK